MFVSYENGHRQLLDKQSINTETLFNSWEKQANKQCTLLTYGECTNTADTVLNAIISNQFGDRTNDFVNCTKTEVDKNLSKNQEWSVVKLKSFLTAFACTKIQSYQTPSSMLSQFLELVKQ